MCECVRACVRVCVDVHVSGWVHLRERERDRACVVVMRVGERVFVYLFLKDTVCVKVSQCLTREGAGLGVCMCEYVLVIVWGHE